MLPGQNFASGGISFSKNTHSSLMRLCTSNLEFFSKTYKQNYFKESESVAKRARREAATGSSIIQNYKVGFGFNHSF